MQYADPALTWTEWVQENDDRDEATKLAALRDYIEATARRWVHDCTYDAAWANKKFAKLGMTARIEHESTYVLSVPASGTLAISVYAANRTEAVEKFHKALAPDRGYMITGPTPLAYPTFTDGPEDSPTLADDDAPTTVDATLVTLREIILLGHIAGPRICQTAADQVLRSFGLAPIPERKTFTVKQPVEAVMTTTVEAYDEASAQRVAGWRWQNGQSGFTVADPTPTDVVSVDANVAA